LFPAEASGTRPIAAAASDDRLTEGCLAIVGEGAASTAREAHGHAQQRPTPKAEAAE
jgi:hypothetical protein